MEAVAMSQLSTVAMVAVPAVVTTTLATLLFLWFRHPAKTISYIQSLGFLVLGMRHKSVEVRGLRVSYAEKGRPKEGVPSLLLVHGFTASKDMWLTILPKLARDVHTVVVDLPGHGHSQIPDDNFEPSIPNMADFLHEFNEEIQMTSRPFHLVGISLGGAISAVYGTAYPDHVALLTLICPSIPTPEDTAFFKEVRAGRCSLLPETHQDMSAMLDLCIYNKSPLAANKQLVKGLMTLRKPKEKFFWKVFMQITHKMDDDFDVLRQKASQMTSPTQIMWGAHDELIHVSGADLLQSLLPNITTVDILDECGHLPTFDRPRELIARLVNFRNDHGADNVD